MLMSLQKLNASKKIASVVLMHFTEDAELTITFV